ncbi:MAG: Asd/ArgC dimerization domain-containing protein [Planctomycetota bacterium]|jgi:aspartate-semialdehyde dehydrogenase|nr:Asd/ArgC dimerization domain-containing protein [Planctomycetota bacterium]
MKRIPVAVAGASGLVGAEICRLLRGHPWFELIATPKQDLSEVGAGRVVFSALPAAIARKWEPEWVEKGLWVFSNSGSWPPGSNPPFIAELHGIHIRKLENPSLVLSPNCVVQGAALVLAPLKKFGIQSTTLRTEQALSGGGRRLLEAGLKGEKISPHIEGEEERILAELPIALDTELGLDLNCARVSNPHGHQLHFSMKFQEQVSAGEIHNAWTQFPNPTLPSAPAQLFQVLEGANRPNLGLDLNAGNGMTLSVGEVGQSSTGSWQFTVLVHNLIRGAAGASLLMAEAVAQSKSWPFEE